MYIPKPYFENIPQIGDLTLDYIFIENGYPILFTCCKEEKLYLCLCRTIYEEQRWIISEINSHILEQIIKNELTIYDAFKNNVGKACIARWKKIDPRETYEVISSNQLRESDLPDKTIYLDDDGESQEYLEIIKNREQNIKEKNTTFSNLEKINSFVTNISVNFDLNDFEINCDDIIYSNNAKSTINKSDAELFYVSKLSYEKDKLVDIINEHDGKEHIKFAA